MTNTEQTQLEQLTEKSELQRLAVRTARTLLPYGVKLTQDHINQAVENTVNIPRYNTVSPEKIENELKVWIGYIF